MKLKALWTLDVRCLNHGETGGLTASVKRES